jgi:LmbE family N-acetylglucosaminyl deacetylase
LGVGTSSAIVARSATAINLVVLIESFRGRDDRTRGPDPSITGKYYDPILVPARILLVFAHPDDESFVAAGLSRRYADAGAEIALVTATRGEAGSCGDPPLCTAEDLPAVRESELRAAATILGIAEVRILGYRDQHLAEAPPDAIRAQLVGILRRHRPQIVVTYDPQGGHGHADHVAISRFTTDAISAAGDRRWYSGGDAPHRVERLLWTPPVLAWDDPPPPRVEAEAGIDFLLDISAQKGAKLAALRAHRTQHRSTARWILGKPRVDEILAIETFRQAWGPPLDSPPVDDILIDLGID